MNILATRRGYALLLTAIVLAGGYLRFRGIAWGLPDAAHPDYSYHPDEAFQMRCAAAMAGGRAIAVNFVYGGTLYFSVLRAYARLGEWLLASGNPLADALLVGRCCTALMATLAIPLAAAMARRIGGTGAGLAAAATLAVAPAPAFLAVTVRPDEGAALLALAVSYCALRLVDAGSDRRAWCVACGSALGLLLAWRLPHGVFASSALVATWFHARPRGVRATVAWLLGTEHRVIGAVAVVGYVALSPHTLMYPSLWREGMGALVQLQSGVFEDAVERGPVLYQWGVRMLVEGLGIGGYAMALLGAIAALRGRDPARLVVLAGALAYFALTPLASWVVVRFTLPMLAPLLVLGAVACVDVGRARAGPVLAPALLLLAVVPAALADTALLGSLVARDARDRATDWLAAELAPRTSVVTFRQYEFDRSLNPVVPASLVDSPFPLHSGIDPALIASSPLGDVVVVNDDLYANLDRLGPRHPREGTRKLGVLLAPGGSYELATTIVTPLRIWGVDFSGWFQSQDFRILHPALRVYRRRAIPVTG